MSNGILSHLLPALTLKSMFGDIDIIIAWPTLYAHHRENKICNPNNITAHHNCFPTAASTTHAHRKSTYLLNRFGESILCVYPREYRYLMYFQFNKFDCAAHYYYSMITVGESYKIHNSDQTDFLWFIHIIMQPFLSASHSIYLGHRTHSSLHIIFRN